MAEVLREMQLGADGGLVPARGSVPHHWRRGSKHVKDDSAAIGATKADRKMAAVARNKAVGSFVGDIGVTKADLVNKEAAGTGMAKAASWSDFGTCDAKAVPGYKEVAGNFTGGEVGVTKADLGNKEAAGIFTSGIGVTKVELGNKEAAGRFTGEIGVTKAELGNKEAIGKAAGEMGFTKAVVGNKEVVGTGVVTEKRWNEFVFPIDPPAVSERKAEPTGPMITKEMVPDSFIERLKDIPIYKKLPPLIDTTGVFAQFPTMRDQYLTAMTNKNYCIDLHVDILRQYAENGFAEVGVDFTSGVKKIFILTQH